MTVPVVHRIRGRVLPLQQQQIIHICATSCLATVAHSPAHPKCTVVNSAPAASQVAPSHARYLQHGEYPHAALRREQSELHRFTQQNTMLNMMSSPLGTAGSPSRAHLLRMSSFALCSSYVARRPHDDTRTCRDRGRNVGL